MTAWGAEKSNNVRSTFFNRIHLLPKDPWLEHVGVKLVSCPGLHVTSLRPCIHCTYSVLACVWHTCVQESTLRRRFMLLAIHWERCTLPQEYNALETKLEWSTCLGVFWRQSFPPICRATSACVISLFHKQPLYLRKLHSSEDYLKLHNIFNSMFSTCAARSGVL